MKRYVIADIHGCTKTFHALLEKISLQKADQLFLLGDYIDKGKDGAGVIDKIISLMDSMELATQRNIE